MNSSLSQPSAAGLANASASVATIFHTAEMFDLIQRQAEYISKSDMIPKEFKGKPENCAIALEISARLGASYFMVMQSLDVIQGRPSWRAKFLIGMINTCGRFGPLQFDTQVTGPEKTVVIEYQEKNGFGPSAQNVLKKLNYSYTPTTCRAYAVSRVTGETVYGPPVSYDLAIEEGWVAKAGSKWQTSMRELMLMYRAGAWFANLHASDITLGMQTAEEARDMGPVIEVESTSLPPASTPQPRANPYAQFRPAPAAEPTQQEQPAAASATTTARSSRSASKAGAPAADPAPAAKEKEAPASAERGFIAFYDSCEVKTGGTTEKPWKKYTVNYFIRPGYASRASTFSDTMVGPLEHADEGTRIRIETTPASNPRYDDTLTFLEVLPEEAQQQADDKAPFTDGTADIPY